MQYKIIDCHYHPSNANNPSCIEDVEQAFHVMDQLSLDAICLQSITLWYPWAAHLNALELLMKLRRPDRIYAFGGIRYPEINAPDKRSDYAAQAKQLVELGFDGIKMFAKPTVRAEFGEPINSSIYDELYKWLNDTQTPVLFHIADPETFWDANRIPPAFKAKGWFYGNGKYPSQERIFQEFEDVLCRYPTLNIVVPHFYFMSDNLPRLASLFDAYPSLKIDCTPGIEMYYNFSSNAVNARAFFLKYADRILFGTDNYGKSADDNFDYMALASSTIAYVRDMLERPMATIEGTRQNGLSLPEDVLRKIYAENFLAFVGGTPKLVELQKALAFAEETLVFAEQQNYTTSVEQARIILDQMKALCQDKT